ncbi:unnamed protein product [Prorocentrum cordatum]|uniref:Uncharacterized protein n=1 Tax=Prorocentrum cordatum TaxID=2364126 RepID=A0ABN9X464_9DINO|nr:unnamed protein product [Polarella glacialis]
MCRHQAAHAPHPAGLRMQLPLVRLPWLAVALSTASAAARAPTTKEPHDRRLEGSLVQTWRSRLDGEALDEGAGAAAATPVTKVVNLLKDMSVTLRREMEEDAAMFKQLGCWCGSNLQSKREAVDAAQAALSSLNATIESSAAKASELEQSIAQLGEEMAASKKTLAEAAAMRQKESAQFHSMEVDAIQNIEALKAAIVVLGKHHGEGPTQLQLPSLLAVKQKATDRTWALSLEDGWDQGETLVIQRALKAAASFAQARHSEEELASYAPRSGEILGLLKQLKDEMSTSLNESQAEEMTRLNTFEDLRASKQSEIEALYQQVQQKQDRLAQATNDHAEAKEDYHQTEEALDEDTRFLLNLEATCKDGEKSFEARKTARMKEIEAVSDTIAILTSDESQEAMAHTFGSGASFVQVGARRGRDLRGLRRAAAGVLRSARAAGGSPDLSILATSVELDSFTRVKKAIDDMISILKVQQTDEVKKNDWCTSQIHENEMEASRTDALQSDLSSKADDLGQRVAQLAEDVAAAKKHIQQLHIDLQAASENRRKENIDFQHTIADQRAVQAVLREALDRLKKFYDKSLLQTRTRAVDKHAAAGMGSSSLGAALLTALAARRQEPPPPPQQAEYTPHGGSGGVMEMLGKLVQDARALEEDAAAGEQGAQSQYEAIVADTSASVAALQKEVVSNTQLKAQASKEKAETEADAEDAAKELEELQKTGLNLHGECDYLLRNFDARQTARQQEVEALQQAKQILSGAGRGWQGLLQAGRRRPGRLAFAPGPHHRLSYQSSLPPRFRPLSIPLPCK